MMHGPLNVKNVSFKVNGSWLIHDDDTEAT